MRILEGNKTIKLGPKDTLLPSEGPQRSMGPKKINFVKNFLDNNMILISRLRTEIESPPQKIKL